MPVSEVDAHIEIDGTKVVANFEVVHIEAVAVVDGIGSCIPTRVVIHNASTSREVQIE